MSVRRARPALTATDIEDFVAGNIWFELRMEIRREMRASQNDANAAVGTVDGAKFLGRMSGLRDIVDFVENWAADLETEAALQESLEDNENERSTER